MERNINAGNVTIRHIKRAIYQATAKGNLARHQRAIHEEVKYPCKVCDHLDQIQMVVFLNTKRQYMKVWSTHAVLWSIMQIQRVI